MVTMGKGYRQEEDKAQVVRDYLRAMREGAFALAVRIKIANPEVEVWHEKA